MYTQCCTFRFCCVYVPCQLLCNVWMCAFAIAPVQYVRENVQSNPNFSNIVREAGIAASSIPGQRRFISDKQFQTGVWAYREHVNCDFAAACACPVCGDANNAPIVIFDGIGAGVGM